MSAASGAIEVRLLGEADALAWRELRLRGLQDAPEAFGETYEESLARPVEGVVAGFKPEGLARVPIFGAFVGGELVGTCGLARGGQAKVAHKVTLWGMYVTPEARGQGLGAALLTAALAHARAMPGVRQVQLVVLTTNVTAAALYRRHGFQEYGLERRALSHGGVDWDDHLMVYFLDGATP